MEKVSFKSWCKSQGVTAVHNVLRENTNNFPYLTVLRGSDAENIYFSVNASAEVTAGQQTASIASELYVADTINAAGEARIKLCFQGNSTYTSIEDLF